jgi:alkyldihydroxyacetonephosphate synthase
LDKIKSLKTWEKILTPSRVNIDSEELYDASADRYKKYAKVRRVLDVPVPACDRIPRIC